MSKITLVAVGFPFTLWMVCHSDGVIDKFILSIYNKYRGFPQNADQMEKKLQITSLGVMVYPVRQG
jgi:hypothetical protein